MSLLDIYRMSSLEQIEAYLVARRRARWVLTLSEQVAIFRLTKLIRAKMRLDRELK